MPPPRRGSPPTTRHSPPRSPLTSAAQPPTSPMTRWGHMLLNSGKDLIYQNTVSLSQAAAANYMAITANNTSPSAGDTTLAGEITTVGGGLIRKQSTPAHTNGTSTFTLTTTYTANGSDSL